MRRATAAWAIAAVCGTMFPGTAFDGAARGAEPVLPGYADYPQAVERIAKLGRLPGVKVSTLGRTRGDREILVVALGDDGPKPKPALLVVGQVKAEFALGGELCLRLAERFAERREEEAPRKLLAGCKLLFVPFPAPDLCDSQAKTPLYERAGNRTPTDDDRDFAAGEDPPEDLDGDGLITTMRVEDPTGTWMPHPDDPRLMVEADARKNEVGRWKLYREGIDNDRDDLWNEDASEGVAFNRNFPFRYPYFGKSAGPNAASETETQALIDYVYDRPEIAAVLTFTPEDNLFHTWKPNPGAEGNRIKTTVRVADAPYFDFVAELYRGKQGGADCPASPEGQGSFSEWAYFQGGRWSWGARGWWIPKQGPAAEAPAEAAPAAAPDAKTQSPEKPAKADEAKPEGSKSEEVEVKPEVAKPAETQPAEAPKPVEQQAVEAAKKPAKDKRPNDELSALRWGAANRVPIFVDWKPFAHPDFPGKKVEIGGFRPFVRWNPPVEALGGLVDQHGAFLEKVVDLLPRLESPAPRVEVLGGGVYRVTTQVVNRGYLPTAPEMGKIAERNPALQIKLELPAGATLLQGPSRRRLPILRGQGGSTEEIWLIRSPHPTTTVNFTVWCPNVGQANTAAELKP